MRRLLSIVGLAFVLAGCGTRDHVLDMNFPVSANPAQGRSVALASVEDVRVFAPGFSEAGPMLANSKKLSDANLKSRMVGNWRDGHDVLFEVMFPATQNIASVFEGATTDALRRSGYRVLDKTASDALPVALKVKQFWISGSMNTWNATLTTSVEIEVSAPLPGFENGQTYTYQAQQHTGRGIYSYDEWIYEAVDRFKADLLKKLAK